MKDAEVPDQTGLLIKSPSEKLSVTCAEQTVAKVTTNKKHLAIFMTRVVVEPSTNTLAYVKISNCNVRANGLFSTFLSISS